MLEWRAQKRPFLGSRYKGIVVGLEDRHSHESLGTVRGQDGQGTMLALSGP